jgi:hypothetical protein
MSVNRKVTVPLGRATIRYESSFSTDGHYSIGTAHAEAEGVEDAQQFSTSPVSGALSARA